MFFPMTTCKHQMKGMRRNLKASWTFYSYCQGLVNNKLVFTQQLYCCCSCVVLQLMNSLPGREAESVCAGLEVQVHKQTLGKEMEGRGLNVTQTGNMLCVPSCPLVQEKLCPCAISFVGLSNAMSFARRSCITGIGEPNKFTFTSTFIGVQIRN